MKCGRSVEKAASEESMLASEGVNQPGEVKPSAASPLRRFSILLAPFPTIVGFVVRDYT